MAAATTSRTTRPARCKRPHPFLYLEPPAASRRFCVVAGSPGLPVRRRLQFWTAQSTPSTRPCPFSDAFGRRNLSKRLVHERRERNPVGVSRLFQEERSRGRGVGPAGAAQRPDLDVHQCRHGAVQERLHRARAAALFARRDVAEMRARRRQAQRPRQCRLHRAPPHLLRDARQFLVRRLFQGARDRACLEPAHQGVRPRQGPAAGHRLSHRRRGGRALEEHRRPARGAHHPHRDIGQFLGDGRHRAVRSVLGNLLRSRRRHSRRPARQPGRGRRPLHRDLEPRLHAVRADHQGGAHRLAAPVDRHRHGAGAHRRGAAGRARQLRHRPVPRADPRPRRRRPASRPRARTGRATASSPTICAPRAS